MSTGTEPERDHVTAVLQRIALPEGTHPKQLAMKPTHSRLVPTTKWATHHDHMSQFAFCSVDSSPLHVCTDSEPSSKSATPAMTDLHVGVGNLLDRARAVPAAAIASNSGIAAA